MYVFKKQSVQHSYQSFLLFSAYSAKHISDLNVFNHTVYIYPHVASIFANISSTDFIILWFSVNSTGFPRLKSGVPAGLCSLSSVSCEAKFASLFIQVAGRIQFLVACRAEGPPNPRHHQIPNSWFHLLPLASKAAMDESTALSFWNFTMSLLQHLMTSCLLLLARPHNDYIRPTGQSAILPLFSDL